MEEAGESLFFVFGEIPDNKRNANAMLENGIEIWEIIKSAIVHSGHTNIGKTLEFWGDNVAQKPSRKFWAEEF